jgi:hypothetical protein
MENSLAAIIRPKKTAFQWPSLEERVVINGRTGSGKTHAGAWLLSEADFHKQPFIIVDFKRENLFKAIHRRKEIDLDDDLPASNHPGIYHMQILPTEIDALEKWLWRVWKQTHIGLFFDEGALLDRNSAAMKTIQVTGRALKIPVYTLSQRPVGLGRPIFSELNYYMGFHLNDSRDRDTVAEWTPDYGVWEGRQKERLPKFHSRWYDVGADFSCVLGPAPRAEHILQRFDERLRPRKRFL